MDWSTFAGMLGVGALIGIAGTEFGRYATRRRSPGRLITVGLLLICLCVPLAWVGDWPRDVLLGLLAGGVSGPIAWDGARRILEQRPT